LFDEGKVDGVVIVFPESDNPGVKELEEKGVPAVLINGVSGKLDCVKADNLNGAGKAIGHLIELGRRRIGIINGDMRKSDYQERFSAYRSVLSKHNFPYIEELVAHTELPSEPADYGYEGYKGMKGLLIHKPDAVFAADDSLAIGAMKAIKEAGLRIPEDMAVAGFDDVPSASSAVPPLTTVRQPFLELGRKAATVLIERIEKNPPAQQEKILPVELVVRASSQKTVVKE
jgi:LacI family transcriptional regulator